MPEKVFGVFEDQEKKALVVGVNFAQELSLKKWWKIDGKKPDAENQIIDIYSLRSRVFSALLEPFAIGKQSASIRRRI